MRTATVGFPGYFALGRALIGECTRRPFGPNDQRLSCSSPAPAQIVFASVLIHCMSTQVACCAISDCRSYGRTGSELLSSYRCLCLSRCRIVRSLGIGGTQRGQIRARQTTKVEQRGKG